MEGGPLRYGTYRRPRFPCTVVGDALLFPFILYYIKSLVKRVDPKKNIERTKRPLPETTKGVWFVQLRISNVLNKNLACPAAPITLPAVQRIITTAATLRTFHLFFHNWLSPLVTYDVSYGP